MGLKMNGLSTTGEYRSWKGMNSRCYNEKDSSYENYGGRGIVVCDRWKGSDLEKLLNFMEDMGERPQGCSVERIDPNKDYSPENCMWENDGNQAFNKRMTSKNKTGVVGVLFLPNIKSRPWKAYLNFRGFGKRLGTFSTLFDAVCARKSAELKYYPTKEFSGT